MRIAIIDADLIGRKRHRFPNLVSMKLSGYYKELGNHVELKTNYENLSSYDKVFISKVFTDTPIDEKVLQLPNVEYGGTGFFYDKAPKLPYEIEHHMPDYHLYDSWVQKKLDDGGNRNDFKYYLDYSIGFTCYDDKTEILTNQGWKLFKDLNKTELVMTLNPETNEIEWNKPYEYICTHYDGDMYHFKNKYTDLMVTPNHNMYVNKNKKYELIPSEKIKDCHQYKFKKDGIWIGKEREFFCFDEFSKITSKGDFEAIPMDLFLEFLGYYLSRGSTRFKSDTNSYIIRISQNGNKRRNKLKESSFKKIKDCISTLGCKFHENKNGEILISNRQLYTYCKQFGLQYNRFVPDFIKDLSARQIKIFITAYTIGCEVTYKDQNKKTLRITSYSKRLIDDFQELFLKIGDCGDIQCHTKTGSIPHLNEGQAASIYNIYTISLNSRYKTPIFSKQRTNVITQKYNGNIYCVEVKNHIIYVRRNGIAVWCGNTRGCFRQCPFCVNKNYKKAEAHSPLNEFVDNSRKKICLLDDNLFACSSWKDILLNLQSTGKPFQYKQGLDERLLTDEKCKMLFNSKYDGDYIFAFDNIADYELIENKLLLLRKYTNKYPKFYVFCGFDRNDKWDGDFWKQDIFDMMKRIELLMKYHCLPYIMRFNRYLESPYQGVYKTVGAWCNQPSFFKKKSLREFGVASGVDSARNRYIVNFEEKYPKFKYYMDMKWL